MVREEDLELLITAVVAADDEQQARAACAALLRRVGGRVVRAFDCSDEEPGCWSVTISLVSGERATQNVAGALARAVRTFVRRLGEQFPTPRVACEPPTAWTVLEDPALLDDLVPGGERLLVEAWAGGDPQRNSPADPVHRPPGTGDDADWPGVDPSEAGRSGGEPPGGEPPWGERSRHERSGAEGSGDDQSRTDESGPGESGVGESRAAGSQRGEPRAGKSGADGSGAGTGKSGESGAGGSGAGESGLGGSRADESGLEDFGFSESRAGELQPGESGASDFEAGESGAGESGASESKPGKSGAGESAAGGVRAGGSRAGGLSPGEPGAEPEGRSEATGSGPDRAVVTAPATGTRLSLRVDVAAERSASAEWQARAVASRVSRGGKITQVAPHGHLLSVHIDLGSNVNSPTVALHDAVASLGRSGWSAVRWSAGSGSVRWSATPVPPAGITALELTATPASAFVWTVPD